MSDPAQAATVLAETGQRVLHGGLGLLGLGVLGIVGSTLWGLRHAGRPDRGGVFASAVMAVMGGLATYLGYLLGGAAPRATSSIGAYVVLMALIAALLVVRLSRDREEEDREAAPAPPRRRAPRTPASRASTPSRPLSTPSRPASTSTPSPDALRRAVRMVDRAAVDRTPTAQGWGALELAVGAMVAVYVVSAGWMAVDLYQTWRQAPARMAAAQATLALTADVARETRAVGAAAAGTPVVVRLAEGAQAAALSLRCRMRVSEVPVVDGVATIDPWPDDCLIALPGGERRPFLEARAGDRLTCIANQGRTLCDGGQAAAAQPRLTVVSDQPGTVRIDGRRHHRLPLRDVPVSASRHRIEVTLADGRRGVWTLSVGEGETVTVTARHPGAGGGEATATSEGSGDADDGGS